MTTTDTRDIEATVEQVLGRGRGAAGAGRDWSVLAGGVAGSCSAGWQPGGGSGSWHAPRQGQSGVDGATGRLAASKRGAVGAAPTRTCTPHTHTPIAAPLLAGQAVRGCGRRHCSHHGAEQAGGGGMHEDQGAAVQGQVGGRTGWELRAAVATAGQLDRAHARRRRAAAATGMSHCATCCALCVPPHPLAPPVPHVPHVPPAGTPPRLWQTSTSSPRWP